MCRQREAVAPCILREPTAAGASYRDGSSIADRLEASRDGQLGHPEGPEPYCFSPMWWDSVFGPPL
jgi:hypothetical protein